MYSLICADYMVVMLLYIKEIVKSNFCTQTNLSLSGRRDILHLEVNFCLA